MHIIDQSDFKGERITKAQFKVLLRKRSKNSQYCGSMEHESAAFLVIDQLKLMPFYNRDTGEMEDAQRSVIRTLKYCLKCASMADVVRKCSRCDVKFTPGCNIRYLCIECHRYNRVHRDEALGAI